MAAIASRTRPLSSRSAITAMYAGLVLTVVSGIVPILAEGTLTRHLHGIYDGYLDAAEFDSTRSLVLTYLFAVAGIGVLSWLLLIRAAHKGKRWARITATLVFLAATCLAVTNLVVTEYGEPLLPPVIGIAGLLPCVAGLVAVGFLWARPNGGA
ncbi:hypothetical protein ABZ639_11150 [Saccharomonospora sp. NPDC006951]